MFFCLIKKNRLKKQKTNLYEEAGMKQRDKTNKREQSVIWYDAKWGPTKLFSG